jgi:multiple sugar transport system ATP-binding protein
MARVVIEHLTKIFSRPRGESIRAVENVSLEVEDKGFLVLVGPSGCGKTTILRLIAGLEEATEGTISIDGRVVNQVAPKDRDIAMVFQNYALYPHMSAYENMAFGLKLRKLSGSEIEKRIKEAAEMLGLSGCLSRLPAELSGGQRQRVALGRAIARQPKVFLFDEPLSNLDAPMRLQLRREISRLHTRLAATMIYVTHDQVEAMTLGDRVAVMCEGAIQQSAHPLHLYQHPANLFVANFIGSPPMNFFHGVLVQTGNDLFFQHRTGDGASGSHSLLLRLAKETTGPLQGYFGKNVILGIRPEDLADTCHCANAPSDQMAEASIEAVEPTGPEIHLHLTLGDHRFIARVPADLDVKANQKISIVFQMERARFFDPATEKAIG